MILWSVIAVISAGVFLFVCFFLFQVEVRDLFIFSAALQQPEYPKVAKGEQMILFGKNILNVKFVTCFLIYHPCLLQRVNNVWLSLLEMM